MNDLNIEKLIIFRNIIDEEIIKKAVLLINNYHDTDKMIEVAYFELQWLLIDKMQCKDFCGNYWQGYLAELIASSENAFSLASEKGEVDNAILSIAEKDIMILKQLYNYQWINITKRFQDEASSIFNVKKDCKYKSREGIHQLFLSKNSVCELQKYYNYKGCGIFEKYDAFKWEEKKGLTGIEEYDPITLEDLTGYDRQKEMLIENTEFFIKGKKANNILLYGDKGTGKSSSVKALLNRYKSSKLKMIEITKEQFYSFSEILKTIKDRGYYFIIFIDDLSFEEFETEYKQFKAILEGGLETKPKNVVIYTTSNRRNIVKEVWKDQLEASGDIHISDSVQEKISLADRFGITITYPAPDKNLFLRMVLDLAKKENITISQDILFEEALKWEMRYHGRSGRSARQFINFMVSKGNK